MIRIVGRGGGTAEQRESYAESISESASPRTPLSQEHQTQEYRSEPHNAYGVPPQGYTTQGYPPQAYPPLAYPPHQAPRGRMGSDGRRKPLGWLSRFPFLTLLIILACIVVFIVTMGVNNCPAQPLYPGVSCLLPWLGRFSFEPWNVNPMLGPTAKTLLDMGALNSTYVLILHQTWRLLTAMWLHAGVFHILSNMLGVYFLGAPMEKEFGLLKVAVIYFLSGVSGAILSSLLLGNQVSVGASGALFGLAGATMAEIAINWDLYANKISAFISILVLILINLAIGLLPYVDNFAHIGGCIAGILIGFALLVKPQRGYVDLHHRDNVSAAASAAEAGILVLTSRNSACQNFTRVAGAVIFLALFATGLAFVLTGTEANCPWCHYLSCVPTSLWQCDTSSSAAPGGTGPVCQTYTYTNGTGILVCANNTSQTFANLTSYTEFRLRELCTETCG